MFGRERNGYDEADAVGYTTERVNLSGGAMSIREYAPSEYGPDEGKRPQVVVGIGWGTTTETYHEFSKGLSEERSVLIPEIGHGSSSEAESESGMPDEELRKAAAMIAALEGRNVKDGQMVLHSEAGIWGLIAAEAAPERISDVVLINPAGMLSEESMPRLMKNYSADMVSQTVRAIKSKKIREAVLTTLKEGVKATGDAPLKSFREVFAMTNSDIKEMIKGIRERGGKVSVVFSNEDKAFPPERVLAELGLEDVDGVSMFIDSKATHGEPYLNPEMTSGAISQILDGFSSNTK